MERLVVVADRVAFLIPAGDKFETEQRGAAVTCTRYHLLDIIVADRDYLQGQEAAFGGSGSLGVVAIKDELLAAMSQTPHSPPLRPVEATPLEIVVEGKDTPGRQCWVLTCQLHAGTAVFTS